MGASKNLNPASAGAVGYDTRACRWARRQTTTKGHFRKTVSRRSAALLNPPNPAPTTTIPITTPIMNVQRILTTLVAAVVLNGLAATPRLLAAEAKPKYSTKDIMKALNKGDENIGKKVARGQGTPEDFSKLVDYYSALPANKPPRGDQSSWDAKTAALVKVSKSLMAGEPGALAAYKTAVNCKACHSEHKPEKKP